MRERPPLPIRRCLVELDTQQRGPEPILRPARPTGLPVTRGRSVFCRGTDEVTLRQRADRAARCAGRCLDHQCPGPARRHFWLSSSPAFRVWRFQDFRKSGSETMQLSGGSARIYQSESRRCSRLRYFPRIMAMPFRTSRMTVSGCDDVCHTSLLIRSGPNSASAITR